MQKVKAIDLFYFDAGGGHRSAALALQQVVAEQNRPWNLRLVNLQELLAPLDIFRKITRIPLQDIYNLILRKGWTLGSPQAARVMQSVIRLYHTQQVKLLRKHFAASKPDLLVSVIPNFNRSLFEGLALACPGTPMVTVLTDLADWPPHFWMEHQPQYFICGTQRAVEQARAMGHPESRVFQTSGMVLHPRYYQTPVIDRRQERQRLGLHPDLPTGIVLFGGYGSSSMLEITSRLAASRMDIQLMLMYGHNRNLGERLTAMPTAMPKHVEGFTREMPRFMRMCDFFIGKPGPGSLSEALISKLPVIVERNAWTMPQERYNAEWIREQNVGIVLPSFRGIADAVSRLLEPNAYAGFCKSIQAHQNRAVFEIPDIFERILEQTS